MRLLSSVIDGSDLGPPHFPVQQPCTSALLFSPEGPGEIILPISPPILDGFQIH